MFGEQQSVDRETLEILNPFLDVLRSNSRISIPIETLEGALSHFLATLQGDQLDDFVEDLLNSSSLWRAIGSDGVQRAVRFAPGAAVASLRPISQNTFFKRNQLNKAAQKWLAGILESIKKANSPKNAPYVYLGILNGLDDARDVKWGQPRTALEEEVIVAASERLETKEDDDLSYYCAAARHSKLSRLRALNLKSVAPRLSVAVFKRLGFSLTEPLDMSGFDEAKAALYSKGFARTIEALVEGNEKEQKCAWDMIFVFTSRMIECGRYYSKEWKNVRRPIINGESWNRMKAAQMAFTTIEWPAVQLLLQPTCPQTSEQRCSLAALIVVTLSKFSILSEDPDINLESYEKVLYGCLDILAAEGGTRVVHQLFKDLYKPNTSDSLAGFILVAAEQLIHIVDSETIREIVFPLAEKHIVRPQHRTSFEAANAFLLTLVETASQRLQYDPSQGPFVDALVTICAVSLLQGARDGSVKPDQLGAAYPGVVRAASRRSVDLVYACIGHINAASIPSAEYSKTIRTIRVAVAPFIPKPDLQAYLDNLVPVILSTPRDSDERLELSALTFKTIMQDMPDESKQLAIDWWLRWRRRIEGKNNETTARL